MDEHNRASLEKMVAHHRMMVAQLGNRVVRLAGAAEDGHWAQAMESVRSYLESEVFPHARAEEETVYAAASAAGLGARLEEMVVEHRRLVAEAQNLTDSEPESDALDTARGIASLFAAHAEKENTFILAPLAGDPNVDLASLLGGVGVLSQAEAIDGQEVDFVVEWQLAGATTGHTDGVRRGASKDSLIGVGSAHVGSRPC